MWAFVSEMLGDPDRVRAGVRHLAEQERAVRRAHLDPDKEARLWAEKVSECARKWSAYQDQQAAGLKTLAELSEKLADLEETRRHVESELALLRAPRSAPKRSRRTARPSRGPSLPLLPRPSGSSRPRIGSAFTRGWISMSGTRPRATG